MDEHKSLALEGIIPFTSVGTLSVASFSHELSLAQGWKRTGQIPRLRDGRGVVSVIRYLPTRKKRSLLGPLLCIGCGDVLESSKAPKTASAP